MVEQGWSRCPWVLFFIQVSASSGMEAFGQGLAGSSGRKGKRQPSVALSTAATELTLSQRKTLINPALFFSRSAVMPSQTFFSFLFQNPMVTRLAKRLKKNKSADFNTLGLCISSKTTCNIGHQISRSKLLCHALKKIALHILISCNKALSQYWEHFTIH